METNHAIKYIVAKPYNLKIYSFYVNGQPEPHSEHRDTFLEYLISILPHKANVFEKLIFSFKPFFVNVQTKEITELRPDITKKRTIDDNDFNIDKVMKEINQNKDIDFKQQDKNFQDRLKKFQKK